MQLNYTRCLVGALVSVLVLLRSVCPAAGSPQDGLIAFLKAEGDALDSRGTNDGALLGGATFSEGPQGKAFAFPAPGEVAIPASTSLDAPETFTIAFWMRAAEGNQLGTSYQGLVSSDFYGIETSTVPPRTGIHVFAVTEQGVAHSADANGTGAIFPSGEWHHVAGTYDGERLQLFVDGKPHGAPALLQGRVLPMLPGSRFSIGSEDGRTAYPEVFGVRYFDGDIDEVAVFRRALSNEEVESIFREGVKLSECSPLSAAAMSWWKGENGADDSVGSSQGYLKHGTAITSGLVGKAFSFAGDGDEVAITNAPALQGGSQFTIEFWMRAEPDNIIGTSYQGLVNSDFFGVGISTVAPRIGIQAFATTDGWNYVHTADVNGTGVVFPSGEWHHIAATYDSTEVRLFVDGQQAGLGVPLQGVIPPAPPGGYLSIGSEDGRVSCGSCVSSRYFRGQIDEVSIYRKALSQAEIQEIFSAGAAGKCDDRITVDNADTPATTYTGSWSTSATTPGYWGSNYRHDGNTSKGAKTATFTPNLDTAGTYEVYMRYPSRSDYAGNVPVDIVHAEGTTAVVVNQKVNGGRWNLLGTFDFNPGTAGYVRIRTTGTSGYVVADAVKFVLGGTALPSVSIAAADPVAGEPGSGQGTGTFTLSRTGPTAAPLTVYLTTGGTATSGSDYLALPTTLTFAAGSATATATVNVIDDVDSEADETVILTLVNGSAYQVASSPTATVTIKDDDGEIIVDNAAASGMSYVGTWSTSSTTPGYWGSNYRHDSNTAKGTRTASFAPNLPAAGTYQVYIRYPSRSDYAGNVPVDVVHADGTTGVVVNQKVDGGRWNLLGTFNFNPGTAGYVRIRTTGTSGYVVADAVRFVPGGIVLPIVTIAANDPVAGEPGSGQGMGAFTITRTGSTAAPLTVNLTAAGAATSGSDYAALPTTIVLPAGAATIITTVNVIDDGIAEPDEAVVLTLVSGSGYQVGSSSTATVTIKDDDAEIIIDNASASGMNFVGSWSTSTTTPGYWGSNYRHDGNTTKGSKTATFTPNLPAAGTYQVYMRHPSRSDYADNVPVDIVHADGTAAVVVNQKVNGGNWKLLGTFNFSAGTGGNVRIRTTGTSGYVIADAVKWTSGPTPVGAPTPNPELLSYNGNSVRATIRRDPEGAILLEWPTTPATVYALLRSLDGGATWAESGQVIGDGSETSLRLSGEETSALFRIQVETGQ